MTSGLRIKASINLFEDPKTTPDGKIMISEYPHWSENAIMFPQELKQVIYSNKAEDLFPTIVNEKNRTWDQSKLGIYKNDSWAFQKEWRYILRIWPGKEYDDTYETPELIYKQFLSKVNEYVFLNIKPELFDSIEVTLSPKISNGNRILVELLKEKFCPKMVIQNSSLQDCIR